MKILARKTTYQTRAFDIQAVELETPDGRRRTYDLVDHRDSISIVPLDPQGRILFVRQFRLGCAGPLLELPAGLLESGEDPHSGAARELREETGMAADEWVRLGEFYLAPGYANEKMTVFLARSLRPDALPADDDEFLELVALPAAEAYALARSGQIPDSKTLAALFLAEPFLKG